MTYRKDAAVKAEKAFGPNPLVYTVLADAQGDELVERYHAVLAPRDRGNPRSKGGWSASRPISVGKATSPRSSPPGADEPTRRRSRAQPTPLVKRTELTRIAGQTTPYALRRP